MQSTFFRGVLPLVATAVALALMGSGARAQTPKDAPDNPPAIRKALDQKITLDYNGQSLEEALEHLQQKTKLKFVLDIFVIQQMVGGGPPFGGFGVLGGGVAGFPGIAGVGGIPPPPGFPVAPGAGGGGSGTLLKIDNGKVRTALQTMLDQRNLTFVILGDSVVITTEDAGQLRQMRQRVSVDIKGQSLNDALTKLADDTGINLFLDPRQAEKAKSKITLQLENATLETAVRLMTELADLGAVSMGNVLFVTSATRADQLRNENATNNKDARLFGPGGLPSLVVGNAVMPVPIPAQDQPVQPPPPKK